MPNIHHLPDRRTLEQERAAAAFLAGLPEHRRGRIVTASSDPDSWKRKHSAIRQRLERERA